jgi:hypothetical protein
VQMKGSRHHGNSRSSVSASPSRPFACPHHVPLQHARFVFCAREMLMERQGDTTD